MAERQASLRAQLEALQARTNPHFFFNSINTVASLITDDPVLAERTLERLADLFRYALDSNKTRVVAEQFDWVHSVDRLKIAQRLSEQRPAHLPPLQLCLQVNISGEASKSGLAPAEVGAVAQAVAALPRVVLRGLMAIPEPAGSLQAQRAPHRALRELLEEVRAQGLPLDTLSMGMSADLDAAILEGASIVRVGSAIFGARS